VGLGFKSGAKALALIRFEVVMLSGFEYVVAVSSGSEPSRVVTDHRAEVFA